MIYLGTTSLKAYKGDHAPANIYFGGTKMAGWQLVSRLGTALTSNNTYRDTASVLMYGKSAVSGIPAPDTPVSITSASGALRVNGAAVLTMPTLRALEVSAAVTAYTYELGGRRYIADSFNPATGEHIQRIGVQTFNGTEGWTKFDDSADYISNGSFGYYWYHLPVASVELYNQTISTHFKSAVLASTYAPGYIARRGAVTTLTINMPRTIATVNDLRAWLTAQNAAGTPVAFYYPLASAVTSALTAVTVPTHYPSTTITTDGAIKPDLSVTVKEALA